MNIIENTIVGSSVLWPSDPQGAANRLPAGRLDADLRPIQTVLQSPAAQSNRGWLADNLGQKVDLTV